MTNPSYRGALGDVLPDIPDLTTMVFEEAKKISKTIGYPVLIKASAGGGGKDKMDMLITTVQEGNHNMVRAVQNQGVA